MTQRGHIFLELCEARTAVENELKALLDEAQLQCSNTMDQSLMDMYLQDEKEFDPKTDMEQIVGLLERNGILTGRVEIIVDKFTTLLRQCESLLQDCPLSEAHIHNDSLQGKGPYDEDVYATFDEEGINVRIVPPHYEDETDDEFLRSEQEMSHQLQEWFEEEV